MRLNNSMYSLFKYNIGIQAKGQHKLSTDKSNRNLYKTPSSSVKNEISFDRGNKFLSNRKLLSMITKVNDKEIKQLKAVNNVLNFEKGYYYKMQAKSGATSILTAGVNGNVYMPLDDMKLGNDFTLAPSEWHEIAKTEQLFTYLSRDKTGYCAYSSFSNSEIKDNLERVGIKPGWFEIKNDNNTNKFYMTDDGVLYPEYQVEAHRQGFNNSNWFKDGYTMDSKFFVDGKEYKLDDKGHLNIPEGEACVMENLKTIK